MPSRARSTQAWSRRFATISTRRSRWSRLIGARRSGGAQGQRRHCSACSKASADEWFQGDGDSERDRSPHRRARRGQEEPRLRGRRPHPRRAQGRGHRLGGRAGRHHLAPGMNAPLYTTEILRLAARCSETARRSDARGRPRRAPLADLRQPDQRAVQLDERAPGRSDLRSGSTPAPSARRRRRWSSSMRIGRDPR